MKPQRSFDVIVLGSGMAGLGAACSLVRKYPRVLVISRKERGESSPAAGGILDPFLEMTLHHPLFALSKSAFQKYDAMVRGLEARTGHSVGYLKTGMLFAALNQEEVEELKRRYAWQKKSGLPVVWKSREQILESDPSVHPDVLLGLYYPTIARVHPRELLAALKMDALKSGAVFLHTRQPAKILIEHGKVAGVQVGSKQYGAPAVIQATGAWAARAPKLSGLSRIPVKPARGHILIYKGKRPLSTILHTLDGGYLVPWDDHSKRKSEYEYLAGSNVEFAGFSPKITRAGVESVRMKNKRLFPELRRCRIVDRWVGLRPFSDLKRPLIGPSKVKGLWLACGYYRSGILISVYAGQLLAESLISGKLAPALKPFDPRKLL